MTTTAVRAAIVGLLSGIPGIGRVHDRERFAKAQADLIALYTDGSAGAPIRGWHVRRFAEIGRSTLGSGRVVTVTRWVVAGFASFVDADASEVTMDGLVDAIVAAGRLDPTLGGAARSTTAGDQSGFRLVESGPVMFAGVLCHGVRLALDVETIEASISPVGGLADVPGAADRLIEAVVEQLAADAADAFETIEGRIAWDPADAIDLPGAIVHPVEDRCEPMPETYEGRQKVDRHIAVVVTARSDHAEGEGAHAAGGLEVLRRRVLTALLGWGEGTTGLDTPFYYAGGEPVPSAPATVAWRETFVASIFMEP